MKRGQKQKGFTIVELLIVIVVIGILAALSVVAFNGVSQRSTNASIAQTVGSWAKALKMYKTDNGRYPSGWTCLGEGYLYGVTGTETTGTAQCRLTGSSGFTEIESFKSALRPYFNNGQLPTPPFVTAVSTTGTEWRRGIHYAYGGGAGDEVYMQVAYFGNVASCPTVQGLTTYRYSWTGNTMCQYNVGLTTDT